MKPLVFALDAQSRVDAGDENLGRDIMAYIIRPNIRGDLFRW